MRSERLFFAASLLVALAIIFFAALSVGGVGQTRAVPPEVAAGLDVWRTFDCEGCHTLSGSGGNYGPDLTHIFGQRSENYLREFLINPAAFHPGQGVMPRFDLTRSDKDNLLAFLQWVDRQNAGWPPRPIAVNGQGAGNVASAAPSSPIKGDDPVSRGSVLFHGPPGNCVSCHSLTPDVVIVGPSLAGIASRAETRMAGMSVEQYIRDSLLHPSDFIVPGFQDVMVKNLGDALNSDQISDLIAFLMTQ